MHNVGNMNGRVLDLVVTVAQGASYRPNLRNRNNNGMNCGNLNQQHGTGHQICRNGGKSAQINLGAGMQGKDPNSSGEETTLNYDFRFADNDDAAELPGFYVTFMDMDQSRQGRVREKILAKGFEKQLVEAGADIKVDEAVNGDWTSFMSTKEGSGCDNPVDPMSLGMACGVDQRKRAFTLVYERTSSFQIQFQTVCGRRCQDKGQTNGRNFLFSFKSSLTDLCSDTMQPPSLTTEPPTTTPGPACQPACSLPRGTLQHSLITHGDATVAAHNVYKRMTIGGNLRSGAPNQNNAVDGAVAVGGTISGKWNFNKGKTTGVPLDEDWWQQFESIARFARDKGKVHVVTKGGTYNMYDFVPGGQGEDNGQNLVVFNTDERIILTKTHDGRQFGPSVLAPFSEVRLNGNAGYIDGCVIAKSFSTVGGNAGQLQMHGDCYTGQLECDCDSL